jgi:hypothetical protein
VIGYFPFLLRLPKHEKHFSAPREVTEAGTLGSR